MGILCEILMTVVSISVSHAYSWTSSSPTNGSIHYACVGDSVTLAWSIVTTSSERVNDVEWLFVDDSGNTELLATSVLGEVLLSPSARQRLSFVSNAGLRVSDLAQEEFGRYIVRAVITIGSSFVAETRYVYLRMPAPPTTTDRMLHAQIQPTALQQSGDWHVQLACGEFSSWGSLSFSVLWKTPSGRILSSTTTSYREATLTLANPLEEGSYSCFLDIRDPNAKCAYVSPTMLVSNEVRIDTCSVQQALLLTPLQQEKADLASALNIIMGGDEQVRLVNGSRPWNGRVEVKYYNGTWGTVCDDSFTVLSAAVVCRMLGLTRETPVVHDSAFYGPGSLPILLDDVTCLGNETNIFSCSHRPVGQHNCGHGEDVGVDCLPSIRPH